MPGAGNLDADPLFVDAQRGDYHILWGSPCRNAGLANARHPQVDYEGDTRSSIDIGADEFAPHLYWTGKNQIGGTVVIQMIGMPGSAPAVLRIGSGVLDPPIPTIWGDWYLEFPGLRVDLGRLGSNGLASLTYTFPRDFPRPMAFPMQALIGDRLTSLVKLWITR
jgi:hypothetical protein